MTTKLTVVIIVTGNTKTEVDKTLRKIQSLKDVIAVTPQVNHAGDYI